MSTLHPTMGIKYVSDYDGRFFVMSPDAPEYWADGFRDAMIHMSRNRIFLGGAELAGGHEDDYAADDYADGYLSAVILQATWLQP